MIGRYGGGPSNEAWQCPGHTASPLVPLDAQLNRELYRRQLQEGGCFMAARGASQTPTPMV
jgi:hypothetical protein